MSLCFIDVETYSEVDLIKVGTPVYSRHPSTEVLMVAWATDGEEIQFHDFTADMGIPTSLQALIDDDTVTFSAWNAVFEIELLKHVLKIEIPLHRWRCSMVHALSLSLPGSLAAAGSALQLPDELLKMTQGKTLIRQFCMPRKPTKAKPYVRATGESDPEDWQTFCDYNKRDVETERAIFRRLRRWQVPADEWAHWRLDRKINDTGLPIDRVLVTAAIAAAGKNFNEMEGKARLITGLSNPNSPSQLRDWLEAEQGIELPDMTKATVAMALTDEGISDSARAVLEIRQEMGKTSVKKFDALERATNEDGRLRHCLQFYGASRTGRWAGRTFQPQNIPRGNVKSVEQLRDLVESVRSGQQVGMDKLASCIRSAVRAPEGQLLRVSDLANIESRILGWISNSKRMLQTFATDRDIYKDFGTELFRVAYEELTKEQRNYSKPPTLGCGYGLGARGLVAYADGMGQQMDLSQAQEAVDVFREVYWEVPRLWRKLEEATFQITEDRQGEVKVGRLTFEYDKPFLFMALPSGRRLAYLSPKIEKKPAPWDESQFIDCLTYMGTDQYTRKWTRLSTFGGKWVEQACQAISRDLLANGLREADEIGFEIVGHTHDEIIALSGADDWLDDDVLSWCMYQLPSWGDKHLYLGAEGFSDYLYRKD